MKILLRTFLLSLLIVLSSCQKNNNYPSINFIGGKGIISQDIVLKQNDVFKIGINSFSVSEYNLHKFKLIRVYDNDPHIIIDSTISEKFFNAVFNLPTSEKEGIERWIFSISSQDGYTSEISVKIKTSNIENDYIESGDMYIKNYILDDLPNNNDIYYVIILILILIILGLIFKKKKEINIEKKEINLNKIYIGIAVLFIIILCLVLLYFNLFSIYF